MEIKQLKAEIIEVVVPKFTRILCDEFKQLEEYVHFITTNFIAPSEATWIITEITFKGLKSVLQGGDNGFALEFVLEKKENQIEISLGLVKSRDEIQFDTKIIINDDNFRIQIDDAVEEYMLRSKILVKEYLSKVPDYKLF